MTLPAERHLRGRRQPARLAEARPAEARPAEAPLAGGLAQPLSCHVPWRVQKRGGTDPSRPSPTRLTVTAGQAGLRADVFLALQYPLLSRTRVRQKIQMGESLLNGRRYASSARLREGDEISVTWRRHPADDPPAALVVLYEDDGLLAVDKPAGVPVHPAGGRQSSTLIQSARAALRGSIAMALSRGDPSFYPSLVHRIDTFTSGVVLIAKSRDVLARMHELAAAGGLGKEYVAVVEGLVAGEAGRIESPIGPDEGSRVRIRMAVRPDGRPAVTEYEVLRRLAGHTLLKARPLTGRTHQVRVHLAAAGHPVWGDLIYKDESLFLRYWENGSCLDASLPPRHLLHAARVSFTHPLTGRVVVVESPLPADFEAILRSLHAG